jgi:hypothetical protein
MLHQNLSHQLRANGDKMLAVFERACALFFQPQIGLVDKCGTLQSVVGTFLSQVTMRHAPQFVVNAREYGAQGLVVASLPSRQQFIESVGRQLGQLALRLETPVERLKTKISARGVKVNLLKLKINR